MLKLKNIKKDYIAGDSVVPALRGVDIEFRKSEFVAILGPSGCGKTTLLNIIGGLDRYSEGSLSVNGRPTENFSDADWDAYRNHSIGFVFQSYNLIPHQTVLANVELALTLSGVPKAERRRRAEEALRRVGLGDQLKKKPNQMSGGQMQRVAIARALVNDPEILLADEPTGALDSENSIALMEVLRTISRDRLIIMVTHNPELAERYATRTVRLFDGEITDDTDPYKPGEDAVKAADKPDGTANGTAHGKIKHTSMSFMTALSLSCNNLLTKKTRTFMTAFAGSIGIIGIALILSLSNGIQDYINQVQEDTLSSYPIALQSESVDISSMFRAAQDSNDPDDNASDPDDGGTAIAEPGDYVYVNNVMYDLVNSVNSLETTKNNLSAFKEYLETEEADGGLPLADCASSVMYEYDVPLNIYVEDKSGRIVKTDVVSMMKNMMTTVSGGDADTISGLFSSAGSYMSMYSGLEVWEEMLPPAAGSDSGILVSDLLTEQYDLLYGNWPKNYDEVILVVNSRNQVSDLVLFSLGLITAEEMSEAFVKMERGEEIKNENGPWSFEEMCGRKMKLVLSSDYYTYDAATGKYTDISATELGISTLFAGGLELKISGIVRANPDALSTAMQGGLCYTTALTDYVIEKTGESDIIAAQQADSETDIITGLPFPDENAPELTDAEKAAEFREYIKTLPGAKKAEIYTALMSIPSEEYIKSMTDTYMQGQTRESIEAMILEEYPEYASMMADIPEETLLGYIREMMRERITAEYAELMSTTLGALTTDELAAMLDSAELDDAGYVSLYDEYMPARFSESTYEENMKLLGSVDRNSPSAIYIYAATFADKDEISAKIDEYNAAVTDEDKITYTDYVALLMSSITTILNAITYVLVAFVAISLVVSSIMIGIITYISVLERTKEIGILRAIGASKRDISRVFNAETLIVGFCSGMLGIISTVILCFPINIIIRALTEINNIGAVLPLAGGVILVAISMVLTLTAGLIPARIAAKKDPVVALRTE